MPARPRLLIAVFLLASVACGAPTANPSAKVTPAPVSTPSTGTIEHASFTVNGKLRLYRVFVPKSLDPNQPSPLVVLLHGCDLMRGSGDEVAADTHFDEEASAGHFVAVYPDGQISDFSVLGRMRCWNAGSCCIENVSTPVADDVAFVSQVLDRVTADHSIDKARMFIAGVSAGGFMAYRLACELSSRIAGMASIAGAMLIDNCHPARPVSILEMHGTDDSNVPYDGGAVFNGAASPSVPSVMQSWATLDGCTGSSTQSQSGITKTSAWTNCKGGKIVELDTVVGGHHTWFGSTIDPVPGEPNANATIWSFFSSLQ
jgi:polyhydroxybutyrate depolymerase